MKVTLNDTPLELASPISVNALLRQLDRRQPGLALAINQIIVPRADWDRQLVRDGDDILLFQAIAGG
ncbi:sulfur carrier protein ThiS [Affinibrenneria salicis]|uniref:Sulfur carrier protein ThiS n=1 Tax=Affinibrenneria salicis TaxID=2590031 RepID=A0A5J5FQQ4_9GAMM|nr:sulfur carrier protein ThiS [Affinibrenneria salicis]KAA8995071.1 sulfur carrier protein ThiS [Affinibrenneria salicis]